MYVYRDNSVPPGIIEENGVKYQFVVYQQQHLDSYMWLNINVIMKMHYNQIVTFHTGNKWVLVFSEFSMPASHPYACFSCMGFIVYTYIFYMQKWLHKAYVLSCRNLVSCARIVCSVGLHTAIELQNLW